DGRLYVTPVDSEQLLCLDAGTGKVIWSAIPPHAKGCPVTSQYVNAAMIGVTSQGELALSGQDLVLYDLKSGKTTWSFTLTFHSTWSRPNPAWQVGADY